MAFIKKGHEFKDESGVVVLIATGDIFPDGPILKNVMFPDGTRPKPGGSLPKEWAGASLALRRALDAMLEKE